ncbi:MAG TPA: MotA/TolQ/ExbB proton channel family protein [Polyangiaceae bacterium]|jgi:biopolymer transport protein ExbB/biopolymer transport protein TolQ
MQFTLTDLWLHMGLFARGIVVVLAAMSMMSLLVAAERALAYRRSQRESRRFASTLSGMLGSGDLDAASRVDAKAYGYLGKVISAGLAAWRSTGAVGGEVAFESVARALERQSQREIQEMKRGQSVLATVSSTAPFVGLLGTVMGIVNSFQSMAASGSGGLGTVSAGIAEALVTTAFGLLVAIPAVVAYNSLQSWVDARAVDLSESSNELLDLVARRVRRA